jgi:hypothetical protein
LASDRNDLAEKMSVDRTGTSDAIASRYRKQLDAWLLQAPTWRRTFKALARGQTMISRSISRIASMTTRG